ncbi:tetratricopeptide repeat protein [Sulfobacillus harzensis]|uniref:tetratricopeptide repeat protein n=1 Tax=Sulfobacillus harzensis TaxID=2729629 RepID=UPI001FAE6AC9|nr:tetratricopeptide repeat protein [Sulfobacillus harzensis]
MAERVPDLSLVRHLKAKGRYEEAERQLRIWLDEDPENPRLVFEMAVILDNQGREAEAIDFYQSALDGDLDGAHRIDAMIGLGSSLRVVGRVLESYQVLEKAHHEYPHHMALAVFYALTLEQMGNYGEAISTLLQVIAETGREESLDVYRPAIRYYRDHRHDFRSSRNKKE